jgi:hypothetical protein
MPSTSSTTTTTLACSAGWLPEHPFTGPLRLIASALPGTFGTDDLLEAVQRRRWQDLRVQLLTVDERRRMIVAYLARFGKTRQPRCGVRGLIGEAADADAPLARGGKLANPRVVDQERAGHCWSSLY